MPRHEDDLTGDAWEKGDGLVSIKDLVEHLEEVLGNADTIGANTAYAARTAAYLIRVTGMLHPEVIDVANGTVPYCDPELTQYIKKNRSRGVQ